MIIIDTALEQRRAQGRPIRVGMIGAGFQASGIALQIIKSVPGIQLCAIANRTIERAVACYTQAGVSARRVDNAAGLQAAIADGAYAVTDDADLLARAPELEAIIEVTGTLDYAAGCVLAAIENGKHVIQMNAELDGTIGPILKHYADEAGVIFTFSDGDQPGVEMNLLRFVRGLGVRPLLAGNIKGLHDPYRNPQTQAGFAAKWGQNAAMVASFADGTKISFEQAIVANGNGFRVARQGMLGPDFSGGDPGAPLVPVEQCIGSFADHLDPDGPGLVDYVVGARPGPGVFVIGTTNDPRQQHYLNYYKMGEGPFYVFTTPYHLCHFEVPFSVARAVLFRDAVLAPKGGPTVGVLAIAKQDLAPGTMIKEFGGFEVYGVADNIDAIRSERLLPIGLALGSTVKRPIAKDQPLTFDDVSRPAGRLVDRLYDEQEALFGNQEATSTGLSEAQA
uniref:NAD(P)H-dependent oxidoreductase n=1 Tax=uncultured Sphingomonas sp. TaxID=158754 RepID=UPI0025DA65CA|nr:SAF domain-containing protein [uncultured Sphingomonas sp.]